MTEQSGWELIRFGAMQGLQAVVPAVVIGLVVNYCVSRWQHSYARSRKITDFQDDTYRRARSLFVDMVYTFDVDMLVSQASGGGTTTTEATVDSTALVQKIGQHRIQLANLASDIERLFSASAHAACTDAVVRLLSYYADAPALLEIAARSEAPEFSALRRKQQDAMFAVRTALYFLSQEIGVDPKRPWWRLRAPARYGRREGDITNEMRQLGPPLQLGKKGKQRRFVDRVWKSIGGGTRSGGG